MVKAFQIKPRHRISFLKHLFVFFRKLVPAYPFVPEAVKNLLCGNQSGAVFIADIPDVLKEKPKVVLLCEPGKRYRRMRKTIR
jgi:hypothetical protein